MTLSRQLHLMSCFPWDTLWPGECYYTPQGRGEDLLSLQLHFFSDQLHLLTLISSLPHPLLNWGFHMTAPHSKFSFTKKWHGTNLAARTTLYILCFSCSLSHSWAGQHPKLDGPFVSSITAGPICWALCITHCFSLPPRWLFLLKRKSPIQNQIHTNIIRSITKAMEILHLSISYG